VAVVDLVLLLQVDSASSSQQGAWVVSEVEQPSHQADSVVLALERPLRLAEASVVSVNNPADLERSSPLPVDSDRHHHSSNSRQVGSDNPVQVVVLGPAAPAMEASAAVLIPLVDSAVSQLTVGSGDPALPSAA
jgi:hypothetical protein